MQFSTKFLTSKVLESLETDECTDGKRKGVRAPKMKHFQNV